MPIYEYKCRACGTVSELLVGRADDPCGLICKSCGRGNLEKLMSAPNVRTVQTTKVGKIDCGMADDCKGQSPGCASGCCAIK